MSRRPTFASIARFPSPRTRRGTGTAKDRVSILDPSTRRPHRRGPRRPRSVPALVELRIRGGPVPHWMQDLGTRWGAGVRLHVCRHAGAAPRRLLQLLEINATPSTPLFQCTELGTLPPRREISVELETASTAPEG